MTRSVAHCVVLSRQGEGREGKGREYRELGLVVGADNLLLY